jgi:hypothetical protein
MASNSPAPEVQPEAEAPGNGSVDPKADSDPKTQADGPSSGDAPGNETIPKEVELEPKPKPKRFSFHDLEDGVLIQVLEYLSLEHRLRMATVCRKWDRLLEAVWMKQRVLYCTFGHFEEPIDCRNKKHRIRKQDFFVGSEYKSGRVLTKCKNLLALFWYHPLDEYFGRTLAKVCPSLEHLYLAWAPVSAMALRDYVQTVPEVKLKCLFWAYSRPNSTAYLRDYRHVLTKCPALEVLGAPVVTYRPELIASILPQLRFLYTYYWDSTPCNRGDSINCYVDIASKGERLEFLNVWQLTDGQIIEICQKVSTLKEVQVYQNMNRMDSRQFLESKGIASLRDWRYCQGSGHPFNKKPHKSNRSKPRTNPRNNYPRSQSKNYGALQQRDRRDSARSVGSERTGYERKVPHY